MVFAAGLGTRLKPLTDTRPKALVEIGGRPLIKHVLDKLVAAGFNRIVVNVHHFANMVEEWIKSHPYTGVDISISDESEMLLDTGGGLKKAAPLFDDNAPILIHNVDILSNIDFKKLYETHADSDATLVVSKRKTSRYLLFNDEMRLTGWTNVNTGEVKSPHENLNPNDFKMLAFSGIHVFSPKLFKEMNGFTNKFGIIDFYLKTCADLIIKGYEKPDLRLMDVGKIDTIDEAGKFLNEM